MVAERCTARCPGTGSGLQTGSSAPHPGSTPGGGGTFAGPARHDPVRSLPLAKVPMRFQHGAAARPLRAAHRTDHVPVVPGRPEVEVTLLPDRGTQVVPRGLGCAHDGCLRWEQVGRASHGRPSVRTDAAPGVIPVSGGDAATLARAFRPPDRNVASPAPSSATHAWSARVNGRRRRARRARDAGTEFGQLRDGPSGPGGSIPAMGARPAGMSAIWSAEPTLPSRARASADPARCWRRCSTGTPAAPR